MGVPGSGDKSDICGSTSSKRRLSTKKFTVFLKSTSFSWGKPIIKATAVLIFLLLACRMQLRECLRFKFFLAMSCRRWEPLSIPMKMPLQPAEAIRSIVSGSRPSVLALHPQEMVVPLESKALQKARSLALLTTKLSCIRSKFFTLYNSCKCKYLRDQQFRGFHSETPAKETVGGTK